MDYAKVYKSLIKKRQNIPIIKGEIYSERHHIIPKSMGGTNRKENIVRLTAREHYVAHWLLFRIYRNKEMTYAFRVMNQTIKKETKREKYKNSRAFMECRKALPLFSKEVGERNKGKIPVNKYKSIIEGRYVYCVTMDTLYLNATHASDLLKIDRASISKVCCGNRKTAGGLEFKYVERIPL